MEKGESSQTKKKVKKKLSRQKRMRIKEVERLSRDPRAFGHLVLLPKHKAHVKQLSPSDRKHGFFVYIDVENLMDDIPLTFDVQTLRVNIEKVLQATYNPNFVVKKVIAIGNMHRFFRRRIRPRPWDGVIMRDVYPRDANCSGTECGGKKIQSAIPHLRASLKFERYTDIADDKLQDQMFFDAQDYGAGCNFLVITADGDFSRLMYLLTDLTFKVYLAKPSICSQRLISQFSPTHIFDLKSVIEI